MMNIKTLSMLIAFLSLLNPISSIVAQETKYELSANVAGGLSTLSYTPELGKRENGFGGAFSLEYTYFFSQYFGLKSGAEFALYNAKHKSDGFNNVSRSLTDPSDGELYDAYTSLSKYQEKQQAYSINIPVMLHFEYGKQNKLYAAAGMKLAIPVKGKYKTSASEVSSKGFFYETGNWGEDQEFMGFGKLSNYSNDESIHFNVLCMLSAEVGMKWQLTEKLDVYTGAYVDYGLNDMASGRGGRNFAKFKDIEEGIVFKNNSLLNSSIGYGETTLKQNLTDKVVPLSVGVKIGVTLPLF